MIGAAALTIGASLALGCWLMMSLWLRLPQQDRSHRDTPPGGLRLLWPMIRIADAYLVPNEGDHASSRLQRKLQAAGLDYTLTPREFRATQLVAAVMPPILMLLLMKERAAWPLLLLLMLLGGAWPWLWLRQRKRLRQDQLVRALPYYLDVITLALEAGSNLVGGFTLALQKSPDSPLRQEFGRVLRDIRAGQSRAEALQAMATRSGNAVLRRLVSAILQAEKSGSSLGPILRAQAEQLRNERFHRAEKQAMEAPVRLLLPLVLFIFPNTFIVVGFVLTNRGVTEGAITWAPLVRLFAGSSG